MPNSNSREVALSGVFDHQSFARREVKLEGTTADTVRSFSKSTQTSRFMVKDLKV
jgi:hypothetical protein